MRGNLSHVPSLRFSPLLLASALAIGVFGSSASFGQKPVTITVLHTNDLHAHIDPTPIRGATYGGYARHQTLVKEIRKKEKNVLLLNAGDVFQGTLFFTLYEGLADLAILNKMGYQAMTLGNHEFDKGPAPLIEFAKRANFPLLAANLDASKEPKLDALIKPSTVIDVEGEKVGIVGTILEETPGISSPGPTVAFKNVLTTTQAEVDRLTAQGVNKIIVMTHVGYEDDRQLAAKLKNVDLIIGGHSHTPLGTPALPGWRASGGPYPTKIKNSEGGETLVVQAWEWGKVMGKIKLSFDASGKIVRVDEAAALVVDSSIPEDPEIAALVDAFRKPVDAVALEKIGRIEESITERGRVGYVLADSYLDATKSLGVTAAFMNPGGVRANFEKGELNYGQAISICPFKNTIVICELTGAQLIEFLEQGDGGQIPSEGTSYRYSGGKASEVIVAGEALDLAKTYKIAVNSFMADGGDRLAVLKTVKKVDTGFIDIDAFVAFIRKSSPLQVSTQARIKK